MKKILVIGGTQFVGRNLVKQLIALQKYDITLFNRGKTNPDLFPEIKKIIGDRNTDDIHKITQQYWDIVMDISCYLPIPFNKLLDALEGKVGRYIYISTGSLYELDPKGTQPMNEDFPTQAYTEEHTQDESSAFYNQKKMACEDILLSKKGLDSIIFRLGLVIGKHDHSDRLYYWFHKVQSQDAFLIPNEGKNAISYSNVSDLAKIFIHAIDVKNKYQIYNANSFNASILDFVSLAKEHLDKDPKLINIGIQQFEKQELKQWTDLPLWVDGDFFRLDNARLKEDFPIKFSSVEETTLTLMDYYGNDLKWRLPKTSAPSLDSSREKEIIDIIQTINIEK